MIYDGVILVDVLYKLRFKPMGAYRIASVLREAGYNILVIDMYSTLSIEELKDLLSDVVSKETLFLGYSSTLFTASLDPKDVGVDHQYEPGLPTLRDYFIETNHYVKTLNPNIKVLFGGASTLQLVDLMNKIDDDMGVDIIVEGYAESMILDVVNHLSSGSDIRVSKVFKNTKFVNYDIEAKGYDFRNHVHLYHESDLISPGEVLPLEVARGCVFKCKFCTFPLLGKHKNDLSYVRTEEQLTREILENYEKYNTLHYSIVDDTFNEKTSKIESMLKVRDAVKLDLNFTAYIRLDLVTALPEQLNLLKELNVSSQYYGVETLTEKSAKAISKGANPDRMVETIHQMYDAFNGRVNMEAGQIIGLPFETRDTVEESVTKLINTPLNSVMFFPLGLIESTHGASELLRNASQYGYEYLGGGAWRNEHWDIAQCNELAKHYTKKYTDSGRLKIGSTLATGMVNLGYDYYEAINITTRDFYQDAMVEETKQKHQATRKKYFSRLKEYLGKV